MSRSKKVTDFEIGIWFRLTHVKEGTEGQGVVTSMQDDRSCDRERCYLKLKHGNRFYEAPFHLTTEQLINFSIKLLKSTSATNYSPQISMEHLLPDLRLGARTQWGTKCTEWRQRALAEAGRFGVPVPLEMRDILLNERVLTLGNRTLSYTGDILTTGQEDGHWTLSEGAYSIEILHEFAAYVLRDVLTRKFYKRFYLPFLITRKPESFKNGRLGSMAQAFKENPEFSRLKDQLKRIPPDSPEDEEDWLYAAPLYGSLLGEQVVESLPEKESSIEEAPIEEESPLDPVYVISRERAQPPVALTKIDEERVSFCSVERDSFVEEGEGSRPRRKFFGDTSTRPYFVGWVSLVHIIAESLMCEPLSKFEIPSLPDPKSDYRFWNYLVSIGSSLSRSARAVRQELMDSLEPDVTYQGLAERIEEGFILTTPIVGETFLRHDEHGFFFVDSNGKNPIWNWDEYVQIACAVLSDPKTQLVAENLYCPFLSAALERWRGSSLHWSFSEEESESIPVHSDKDTPNVVSSPQEEGSRNDGEESVIQGIRAELMKRHEAALQEQLKYFSV